MRITILDGTPGEAGGVEPLAPYLAQLGRRLTERGHAVRNIPLSRMRVAQCRGCFECWVKTPGECTTGDEADALLPDVVNADLLLLASPTIMGFPSALLKRATERLLPLLHPYFRVAEGEIHHRPRYARYPTFALLYGRQDCDDEDAQLIERVYQRVALNFQSTLAIAASTATPPEELCHAIDGV